MKNNQVNKRPKKLLRAFSKKLKQYFETCKLLVFDAPSVNSNSEVSHGYRHYCIHKTNFNICLSKHKKNNYNPHNFSKIIFEFRKQLIINHSLIAFKQQYMRKT